MGAVHRDLWIEAGSYEPEYWLFTDPNTGTFLDLTQTGFTASGSVSTSQLPGGQTVIELDDTYFQRTSTGRTYFAPSSAQSLEWTILRAFYQFYMTHPSGESIRFGDGRFNVSPKI